MTLLIAVAPILAQDCPVNLTQMMTRAIRACKELERNTACYGNGQLSIGISPVYDDPDTVFANSGDQLPIAALSMIDAGGSPVAADTWGIARLEVQANLLAEQPARSSTLWLIGDATIQNLVPPLPELTATAIGTLNLRVSAATDADIIQQLTLRQKAIANGRTSDNRWLRVFVPRTETIAWASMEVIELNGDINTLDVVTPETSFYRPFQIINLTSGTSDSPCGGVPDSGLLIQTPNEIQKVVFIVNGATLYLTGTVFMQSAGAAADAPLTINVLNGQVIVENADHSVSQTIPAGARTQVTDSVPVAAEPYISADFDALPITALPFTFELPAPLTLEQIQLVLNPPVTPTPLSPEPDLHPRCIRTLLQQSNLRGGPADFYEVVGELREGSRIIAVYQSTDADGYIWWQVRSGG
ncbi:MAG TPA: hypothetical protein VHL11_03650, partial [Phototrophicaceae bacterium]|nr:hypothetical protein [Phototrophicaceae bacterium]